MKKTATLFTAIVISLASVAQESKMDKKMQESKKDKTHDCVMMKDGKMTTTMDGKTMPMEKDMTMKNGTMVMKDGTIKTKDGKTMKMKNGECIDMEGKMMKSEDMKMENKEEHKMEK